MLSYYQIRILNCALRIFRFIVITRKDIIRKYIRQCYKKIVKKRICKLLLVYGIQLRLPFFYPL